MKIHGTAKGAALSTKDFGVAFGGAAAAPFSPNDISDLEHWYDADDSSTITKSGANLVSQWDDKQGSNNLVQATGGTQPLWVDDDLNSKDVINFTGSKWMEVDFADLTQPTTIALVFYIPDASGQHNVYDAYASNGSTGFNKHSDNVNMAMYAPDNVTYSKTGIVDNWVYATNIYNTTSSIARIDGTQKVTGDVGTNTMTGLTTAATRGGSGGAYGNIKLAFLVIYNKVVSGTELTNLETYMKDTWGL